MDQLKIALFFLAVAVVAVVMWPDDTPSESSGIVYCSVADPKLPEGESHCVLTRSLTVAPPSLDGDTGDYVRLVVLERADPRVASGERVDNNVYALEFGYLQALKVVPGFTMSECSVTLIGDASDKKIRSLQVICVGEGFENPSARHVVELEPSDSTGP